MATTIGSNARKASLKMVDADHAQKVADAFGLPVEQKPIGKIIPQDRLARLRDLDLRASSLRREQKSIDAERDGLQEAIKLALQAGKEVEKGPLYAKVETVKGRLQPSFFQTWIGQTHGAEKLDEIKRMPGCYGEDKEVAKVYSR